MRPAASVLARTGNRVTFFRHHASLLAAVAIVAAAAACAERRPPATTPSPGPAPAATPSAPGTPPAPSPSPVATAPAASPPRLDSGNLHPPCHPCSPADRLARELDAIFAAPTLRTAVLGVKVQSLDNGEVLYALNPDTLLVPASNEKVVTMAIAAARLGWDFRFETRLETDALVLDGALRGDLVVVGSGDPTINSRGEATGAFTRGTVDPSRVFEAWADALRAAGITRVDGRIVGDDDAFDDERYGVGWAWDDFAYGYQAPVGALQFNENLAEVVVRPGARVGEPARVELRPAESGLAIENRVVTSASGVPTEVDTFRFPGAATLQVRGTIPLGAADVTRDAAVDNPTLFFVRSFRAALVSRGIDVRGEAVDVDDLPNGGSTADAGDETTRVAPRGGSRLPPVADPAAVGGGQGRVNPAAGGVATDAGASGRRILVRHLSPPLAEIGKTLMKVSQNLYAETALRALSLAPGPASVEASQKIEREVLAGWGIAEGQYALADGSGLSRHNLVSASTMLRVLEAMARSTELSAGFEATLPIAGRDGTISTRFKASRAEGNVKAKTGTLMRVRALSGYVTSAGGERLAFSALANHYTVQTHVVDAVVNQAVERLANFTRE